MKTRRAVVVDDEPGARLDLVSLLEREPGIELVGQAGDLAEAEAVIRRERPEVVFLDIRLGNRSGFELVERLDSRTRVIFVTAYEQHALRAFEVDAIDYLLKPVDPERLRVALDRLDAPTPDPARALEPDDWLFLPMESGRCFLQVAGIARVEAAGDYTVVHTVAGRYHRVSRTLKDWEARLPAGLFLRIHRGTIVNLKCVVRVEPWSSYTYRVFLKGIDTPVMMSREYAKRAERFLR